MKKYLLRFLTLQRPVSEVVAMSDGALAKLFLPEEPVTLGSNARWEELLIGEQEPS